MTNNFGCFDPNYPIVNVFATIYPQEESPYRVHILVQNFDDFFHAPPDADIPVLYVEDNTNLWVKKEWLSEISFDQ